MKNILFILHLPPPVHGSSIVGQTIKNSTLINSSLDCRYISYLISSTIDEIGKMSFLKIYRFLIVWSRLLVEIIKHKPEVCYLTLTSRGAAFYKDVLLVATLRFFRIKRVYHLHNKGVSQNNSKKLNNILYRYVFNDADIILLSNQLYHDIEAYVPQSRVHICPNGIEDTSGNFKPRLFPKERPVKILFLSNLIESKGVFVLIDACSILRQKGINFECDFIGAEGNLNAAQFNERVRQNQLSTKVRFLGKKYGKEKQEAFADAEIFAFPTYYSNECFPLVLLEAMCDSLPVVTTFEGGIQDIVEDGMTGFLVPQKNAEVLAEKLEALIKNSELRQLMGKAGRQKYENEFTLNKFEHRMKEILEQI
ncbi:MAG: glycosyltransferase family 4 protein [Bacteroidota bacterium]|nr:glycosyltransferase family 4 protein [Bacteroidota bacterium]